MQIVVGVRFKQAGKIYYFDPNGISLKENDHVIVETVRGIEFGEVVVPPKEVPEDELVLPLKKVIRKATEEDYKRLSENKKKEVRAFNICIKKIKEHNLPMRLVDVEYTFDNNKLIFYFTADGRVDFRALVRDLAAIFRTRIELRQIGVRDKAKMVGGIGPCGRPLCCCCFLGEFEPVSIKMAKEQRLPLNPIKISGVCGRLMCCLKFEQTLYEEARVRMPEINTEVVTPEGPGVVIDTNVIRDTVKVKLTREDGTLDVIEFPVDVIKCENKDSCVEDNDDGQVDG